MSIKRCINHIIEAGFSVCFVIFTIFMIILKPVPAFSHKVNVFAYVEGGKIATQSYFNNGAPCKDSTIQVFDPDGKPLLQGKTDRDGLFSFNIPKRADLRIVLTASMGHKAEYLLKAAEIPDSISEPFTIQAQEKKIEKFADQDKGDSMKGPSGRIDLDQIRTVVQESIQEGLRPVMRELAKAEAQKFSLTEIIGGIGYIFGIMGIILYFKKRD